MLLFDRTRSLSLHLFEHVHGESRDRGQAMVDLKALYERHGLRMSSAASCPIICRCSWSSSSTHPPSRGVRPARRDRRTCWRRSAERLRKRKSAYDAVFRALVALADGQAARRGRRRGPAERARRGPQRSRRARRGLGGGAGHLRPRRPRRTVRQGRPRRQAARARPAPGAR